MKLRYEIQANSAGEARSIAENKAHSEGWTLLTGVYVYPTGDAYTYSVEVYAGSQR